MNTAMRIDAHQHFWQIADRVGQWPPASLAPIHRDFSPRDLWPALQRCGIEGTVLVQTMAAPADTEFMLGLAARHDFIRGVVGWVDMKAADAPQQIERLARHPKLRGVRPMLQDLPDDRWIDDVSLDPAVQALREHGLVFDALVVPRQLPALLAFACRHPGLPMVIDHAAKPDIARGRIDEWSADMASLADLPHVHCKLSGLLTEAGDDPTDARLRPVVDRLFELFGSDRLMWGSDWPVLNLVTDYDDWFAMAHRLCRSQPGVDEQALEGLFGGNAHRFYGLKG